MAAAQKLGERAHYRSAGTVEFLVEQDTASFYMLEINTRLQVDYCMHPYSSQFVWELPVWDSEPSKLTVLQVRSYME